MSYEIFPTPVWAYPLVIGGGTGFWCAVLDHYTLDYGWSLAVAVLLTVQWTLVNAVKRRARAAAGQLVQLGAAVALISVGVLGVFARTGGNLSSARGLTYWTTMNQTYRYNPHWAARPAWLALVGLAWFGVLLCVIAIRRRPADDRACAARHDAQ